MIATATKMGGSQQRATVGRKRQPQTPEIRKTLAGKLGARLAELADSVGLDADQLGDKIGKSGDTVRLYFSGKASPHINDWPKLAKALGVPSVRELLPE
jgi:ribosome-binding protein aMBF1 (putative translation factor)